MDVEPSVDQIGLVPVETPCLIPEKWKWVPLKMVSTKITDGTHHSPVSFPKGDLRGQYLYITAKNIKSSGVDLSTATYVSQEVHAEITSRCCPEYGDVLYIKDGATTGTVTVNTLHEEFSLLSSVALIKPNKDKIDPYFLTYILRTKLLTDSMRSKMKGTGIPRVTLKVLKEFLIPLPPLEEQRRIVEKLNEILPIVANYGEEQEALEKLEKALPGKLRASILQEAIQGKLVPQIDEEPSVEQIGEAPEEVPFAIPEKWKWIRIENLADVNPRVKPNSESDEVSFLPMASVEAGYKNRANLSKTRVWSSVKNGYTKFANQDILLAKITPCFQNRKSVIVEGLTNGLGCGSSEFHVLRARDVIDSRYLLFFLKTDLFIQYGVEHFKGTAGQQRLGTKDLKDCFVPLPPLEEQKRIVNMVDILLSEVDRIGN